MNTREAFEELYILERELRAAKKTMEKALSVMDQRWVEWMRVKTKVDGAVGRSEWKRGGLLAELDQIETVLVGDCVSYEEARLKHVAVDHAASDSYQRARDASFDRLGKPRPFPLLSERQEIQMATPEELASWGCQPSGHSAEEDPNDHSVEEDPAADAKMGETA